MTAKKKPAPKAKKPTLWDDPAAMRKALQVANRALSKAARSDGKLAEENKRLRALVVELKKRTFEVAPIVLTAEERAAFERQAADLMAQQIAKDLDASVMGQVEQAVAAVGGKLSAENVQGLIRAVCTELGDMLVEKNRSYGNSALDPLRVFSRASAVEQIKVRIDDKLSRLARGTNELNEDTVKDLIGYLILLRVAERLQLA